MQAAGPGSGRRRVFQIAKDSLRKATYRIIARPIISRVAIDNQIAGPQSESDIAVQLEKSKAE